MDNFKYKPKVGEVTVEIRIAEPNGEVSVLHGLVQSMTITKDLGQAIHSIGQASPLGYTKSTTRFEIKGIAIEEELQIPLEKHKIKEGRWANIIDEL